MRADFVHKPYVVRTFGRQSAAISAAPSVPGTRRTGSWTGDNFPRLDTGLNGLRSLAWPETCIRHDSDDFSATERG